MPSGPGATDLSSHPLIQPRDSQPLGEGGGGGLPWLIPGLHGRFLVLALPLVVRADVLTEWACAVHLELVGGHRCPGLKLRESAVG